MSDTPSPAPEPLKPRLSLAPKVAAPAEAAPAPAAASHNAPLPGHAAPPAILQSNSGGTPPALLQSSGNKPSLKLNGPVHAANPDKFEAPAFTSPMPAATDDGPSGVIVALSAIAAAAAITFAVLLFLKNQS